MKAAACVVVLAVVVATCAVAQEREVSISGKEIVERLSRIEDGQKSGEQHFSGLERRIDAVEARLEQKIDQRFGELRDFMLWGFGVTFAGIFALVGFVLWDRRTALAPAVRRIEELQDREKRLESALRDYAQGKSDLATSLRNSGLL
jgi:hypothetical protein